MSDTTIGRHDWAMVVALGLVWGSTFLVIEMALEGITPFWLAAARIGFASLLMGLIWWLRGAVLHTDATQKGGWGALLGVGALSSAVPFMLISWGQQYVTSGFSGVSMASVALIVLPMAHFLVPGERLSWRKGAGFLVGFIGVAVLLGGQSFESTGAELEGIGRVSVLMAAACYAISSVMIRRLPPMDPVGLATVQMAIGSAIVIPAALIIEGPPPLPDGRTIIILLILGLVPTAAANLLRVLVIRSAGPTFMSLTNYLVPVWAVFLGALFLGEPLPASLIWALLLILSGVALSQFGSLRRLFFNR